MLPSSDELKQVAAQESYNNFPFTMSSTDQDIEYLMREIANNNVNMSNLPADSMTQAILERLKEEVAKVYAESGAGDEGEAGSPSRSRVQVRHPMPIDLWKRAHEVEGKPKAVSA